VFQLDEAHEIALTAPGVRGAGFFGGHRCSSRFENILGVRRSSAVQDRWHCLATGPLAYFAVILAAAAYFELVYFVQTKLKWFSTFPTIMLSRHLAGSRV
jgi:hypothetical protein